MTGQKYLKDEIALTEEWTEKKGGGKCRHWKGTDSQPICQKNHKNNLNQILNEILEASKKYISKKTLSALTMFGKE